MLHRQLTELGVSNYVAPTKLDPAFKGVCTDKTDARELALAAQGRCLLLAQGWRRNNRWWKPACWNELHSQLPAWLLRALEIYRQLILQVDQPLRELTRTVQAAAPPVRPAGLGALSLEIVRREICDWKRFKNRKQPGSYAGLVGIATLAAVRQVATCTPILAGIAGSESRVTKRGRNVTRLAQSAMKWRLLDRARMTKTNSSLSLTFQPLTPERWRDLESLFGERGACGGCWCMTWRLKRSRYEEQKGPRNKAAFKRIVARGPAPGVIAYSDSEPVGWCAVAPREVHQRLENSRILAPVDDQPVWSVTCFFVARAFRRLGVSVELLKAAVAHAAECGAKIVEGYPVEPRKDPMPDVFAWTGMGSTFRKAGFKEAARRSSTRPIMRIRTEPSL